MSKLMKYKISFITGVVNSMEYRFDFFMSLLSTIFPIIIQVFLWFAIYQGSENTVMYGYTFQQMVMYACMAGAVGQFVNTGIERVINQDIHSGGLGRFLVQPVSYVPFRMMGVIGQKVFSMMTMLILAGVLTFVFHSTIGLGLDAIKLLLFIPALIAAVILNFFIFFVISLSAFWFTEVGSFFGAISVVVMVVSGGVFPIEVLGKTFVSIMQWMPFIYTTNFPIRVISGSVTITQIITGIMIQMLWIGLLMAASQLIWRNGIKKYVVVGG